MCNIETKIDFTKKYKIRDSIDVYIHQLSEDEILIRFYRINTRDSVLIKTHISASLLLAKLDGQRTIEEVISNFQYQDIELENFLNYLMMKKIIKEKWGNEQEKNQYERQINFFDDLIEDADGLECQEKIARKKIAIFGIGSVGGAMAILLARMGVENFVLIDYKRVSQANKIKHLYVSDSNIGKKKTEALKEYLLQINPRCLIETFDEKIMPNSHLDFFIDNKVDLVINTADEPYIGHLSKKIGRYLWEKNIPLFIGGGFDAHSMSCGELIIPNRTKSVDEYQNFFFDQLKNWKPIYAQNYISSPSQEKIIVGGSGSVSPCSLFSASYGCMCIIYYFLNIKIKENSRGEYLINKGVIDWFNIE